MPTEVRINISGSITGEAIQNAITGASGTPAANSDEIRGITPHEQNGDKAQNMEAVNMHLMGWPEKTCATILSAPLALTDAAKPTARIK